MATDYTSNNATFYRVNQCFSFVQAISSVLVPLTAQSCSEVMIINKTGQSIYVYDNDIISTSKRLLLDTNESITLRGITNTTQVSAVTLSGGGNLYFRTQQFSFLPQP